MKEKRGSWQGGAVRREQGRGSREEGPGKERTEQARGSWEAETGKKEEG